MQKKQILLVSTEAVDEDIMGPLNQAGYLVVRARDGQAAVALAKHLSVDKFILVSTGRAMGRTETALNLRDLQPGSEIIFLTRDRRRPTQGEAAAKNIPNTKVLTREDLRSYFAATP